MPRFFSDTSNTCSQFSRNDAQFSMCTFFLTPMAVRVAVDAAVAAARDAMVRDVNGQTATRSGERHWGGTLVGRVVGP